MASQNLSLSSMTRKLERMVRFAYRAIISKPQYLILICLNPKKWIDHESYFPEKERKSNFQIFIDQMIQILKYGTPNKFYFPYGFDIKNRKEQNQYIHYSPFSRRRDYYNVNVNSNRSTIVVLRNKLLFGMFTSYYGIDSGDNLAVSSDDKLFNLKTKTLQSFYDFLATLDSSTIDLFLKPLDGECGSGVYRLIIQDGKYIVNGKESNKEEIKKILSSTPYLIQSTIIQDEKMKSLHPQSLNTIRLVTVRNPKTGEPEVFPSLLRIGCGDSIVDNTSQGGLAVGINIETGRLKEFGFYKPGFGTKVSIRPDSQIKFSDFEIPNFEECKRQAIFLHTQLRDIHSIGWDIALGENGPIFVEGNDNWEINGPQICNGGLRKTFLNQCGE